MAPVRVDVTPSAGPLRATLSTDGAVGTFVAMGCSEVIDILGAGSGFALVQLNASREHRGTSATGLIGDAASHVQSFADMQEEHS